MGFYPALLPLRPLFLWHSEKVALGAAKMRTPTQPLSVSRGALPPPLFSAKVATAARLPFRR